MPKGVLNEHIWLFNPLFNFFRTHLPRMKSVTQDRYWPGRLGSRTRGSGATVHNGLEKIWVAPSVWPMAILVCSVWRIPIFRSFRSGQYPYFGLANTHILVCSVWPIPIFWSVLSGQYPYFGLFGLANTHISVCSVYPIPNFKAWRSSQIRAKLDKCSNNYTIYVQPFVKRSLIHIKKELQFKKKY